MRELVNAERGQPSVIGFTYKVNATLYYQLLPDLAAEVFGNYTSRRIEFHDSHPALLFYTAAIRKQLDDKKASIGITATNPFNGTLISLALITGQTLRKTISARFH